MPVPQSVDGHGAQLQRPAACPPPWHLCATTLFLLFGRVLTDRLPRGPLLVGSRVVSAASQAVIAALVLTHSAAIPLLMWLAAVNGASGSCYQPAAKALLPQTVPAESRRAALALSRIAGSSAMIVGASPGGVLVAAVGPGWGLAVDASHPRCVWQR
ncbi:MFS transporter [Streptomyces sp. NPDC057002]|uniref:MFS transporter n=1 Tax=Streptomyces sp. NPDC057002 TaxID=3345992 RepID=UPI00362CC7D4